MWAALALTHVGCAGCDGDTVIGSCDVQPDLTGHWLLSATAPPVDAGVMGDVVPRGFTLDLQLKQEPSSAAFNVGHAVWGTIASDDKGVFDSLMIPELKKNNGGKTGAELYCTVKINVPIATPVTDDNVDQGPLRIALAGKIVQKGMMLGDPATSLVIMADDATMTPRHFAWTAAQP